MSPADPDSAVCSGVTVPMTRRRFSQMTRLVRPPLGRGVACGRALLSTDHERAPSLDFNPDRGTDLGRSLADGGETAHCRALPFLPMAKARGFLGGVW
jgi:hypothetical protein